MASCGCKRPSGPALGLRRTPARLADSPLYDAATPLSRDPTTHGWCGRVERSGGGDAGRCDAPGPSLIRSHGAARAPPPRWRMATRVAARRHHHLTRDPDLASAVQTADCLPILWPTRGRSGSPRRMPAGADWPPGRRGGCRWRRWRARVRQPAHRISSWPSGRPSACCYEVGADVRDAMSGAASASERELERWFFRRGAADGSFDPSMPAVSQPNGGRITGSSTRAQPRGTSWNGRVSPPIASHASRSCALRAIRVCSVFVSPLTADQPAAWRRLFDEVEWPVVD